MVNRLASPNKNHSLLLFGARGTGKTTLIKSLFGKAKNLLWIDLLTEEDEETYSRHPGTLSQRLAQHSYTHVIIDEVQKVPKLLDIVQKEMEERKIKFILLGSSARKLKRGAANLLAGRAFQYFLFPLTHLELGDDFNLENALRWGGLPKLLEFDSDEDKSLFLKTYVKTYLKEEIVSEQIVRNVAPFRDFLEIAAQTNGQIVNFSNIASDVGVDDKTVKQYFEILEDTLIGFFLPPFHRSVRKRQRESPKFYLFDTGVKKALEQSSHVPLKAETSAFGQAFEHFIILELIRLNEYYQADFKFSYLRTKDDAEVDLIIERAGDQDRLIEIKSARSVSERMVRSLQKFHSSWDKPCVAELWSLDEVPKKIGDVSCLPWRAAVKALFKKR